MPTALVVAARPYFNGLSQAIDQSETYMIRAGFERAIAMAVEHRPDIILVVSAPIRKALETCERLLENRSTRSIPIFIISLGCNMFHSPSSTLRNKHTEARIAGVPNRQIARGNKGKLNADDGQDMVDGTRKTQLLSILDLLRYAEAEVSELELETSAVLLGAAITDLAQNLK
ncbi:hypothetical protein [Bradyrhizobium arachidis]|uniref:hypothetical protein n=1 Tax=Bradyrhizobium arachidis TaxID=858423 RepID=UPI0021624204|nr:hypothetical protein [Bradyrhizobium arachidis]UVO30481.1 hypothetical protein KUF59_07295 [Bradyrhizobium arachidis]